MSLTVWVDADNCPSKLLLFLYKNVCQKKCYKIHLVANHSINIPEQVLSYTSTTVCEQQKDAADDYITENANETDIVITKDIILASRLVEKNITVMNDRGTVFSKMNIKDKLEDRALDLQLANIGLAGKKGSFYSEKQLEKFITCFEKELTRLLRLQMQ